MSNQFYKLKVSGVQHLIKDAVTITLDASTAQQVDWSYAPGQHLTVKFVLDGQEVRRSYSLNSCPYNGEALEITVKRVKGGLVSNYINDCIKVGDRMEVSLPQGRFYADIEAGAYKTYFLFAAGSGITPVLSILKSVLYAAPQAMVHLFYGNMHQDSILFKDKLKDLEKQYSKRLNVVHTLSDPKVWTTWEQWKGRKGRIDAKAVEWFIEHNPPIAQSTEYYICGPGAMNVTIRKTLMELGVPKELIHIEQFGAAGTEENLDINAVDNANIKAKLNGQDYQLTLPKGETILQGLKKAGANPPYSCESGVCGACTAKLVKGKAAMKACMALEDADIKKGMILTCQALPTTENVNVEF